MQKNNSEAHVPTFLGIGGMKCGTTWLSECLRYHPEVFMSAPKELHYFAATRDKSIDWYLAHFDGSTGYKAVGEFSASYLQRPKAAEHIRTTVGNVKLVAMFRDPTQRFISHYKQLMRNGVLPKEEYSALDINTFHKAVELVPKLLGHGNYYRNLVRFIDVFGRDNICVVLKENIDKDSKAEVQKVYRFLGVDGNYTPPILNKKVSTGIVPRFPWLEALRVRLFREINKRSPRLIIYSRKLRVAEMYRKLNSDNRPDHFRVTPQVIKNLYAYYREETENLEQFLGRTLDLWKQPNGGSERQLPSLKPAELMRN